jgi:hypothetical protein
MKANQAAFEIGQVAQRMFEGYFAHVAAIQVAKDPRAAALSPNAQPGEIPEGYVFRKDGGGRYTFHFTH